MLRLMPVIQVLDLLEQFNQYITEYFESGQLQENGIPSIEQIADRISVSQRYLSDTLKNETGKTFLGSVRYLKYSIP